ncbi:Hypothetical protein A7982_09546 [Minicystis rosea]|nr:Hypothetical protein A7982_09546 [Minicystis rosea]
MSLSSLAVDKAAVLLSKGGRPIPLLGVSASGHVFGAHARVVLRQRYRNDEACPVETIYTFPVPGNAALTGFAMETAGRRIEAEVKEREEAFRAYDDAVSKGHGAALLEQERRNVFTASVGNLLPGEETVVEIVYVQPLVADEGALRFVIPTLVAPRYMPGAPKGDRTGHGFAEPTDRVADADRISPSPGKVDYGLSIDVVFDLGRPITIESPSHQILVAPAGEHAKRVTLKQNEVPLDRDLVLTAAGAPGVVGGVVAARRAGEDGTFALTVVPDLFDPTRRAWPRDVVFVVDVSGSMEGDSLREAKSALRLCLRHLAEGDRFQIIAFSDAHETFQPSLVPFTQKMLETADRWVEGLITLGGTEILIPLMVAAGTLRGVEGRDRLIVLLTDGQVGNEAEIVSQVAAKAERTRIYTFGIGTNVSDVLLRDLACCTHGAVEFIHPGERIDEKVTAQFARATAPRIEGLTVRFTGVDVGELAPAETADLVDGEPWSVFGRYETPGFGHAELRGTLRGEPFHLEVPVELPAEAARDGLTALWATARIRDLEEAEPRVGRRRAESNRARIVQLSIDHHLASKYASFVLMEKRTGDRRTHEQPAIRPITVSAPAGWATYRREEKEVEGGLLRCMSLDDAAMAGSFTGAPDALFDADEEAAPVTGRAYAPRAAVVSSAALEEMDLPLAPKEMDLPLAPKESAGPAGDPLAELFARQLANGLWTDGGGADEDRLVATSHALQACLESAIDSTHPMYGAQVKKAVEALCALALALLARPVADRGALVAALGLALSVSVGRRLREQLRATLARVQGGPG